MWACYPCFSVWMCVQPQLTQRWMLLTVRYVSSRRRDQASTDCGRLVHASLRWPCSRKEWGKDAQWQLRKVCSQIWVYIRRHKEAHSFCCFDVCVCTRKRMWKAWRLIQCKSSSVVFLKHSLWTPQSMRIWLACGNSGHSYNWIQVCEDVKVHQKTVDSGRRRNRKISYCTGEVFQIRGKPSAQLIKKHTLSLGVTKPMAWCEINYIIR